MRSLKFKHVFVLLMIFSFIAAFLLPRYTTPRKPQLEALFAPVSRPAGVVGLWLRTKFGPKKVVDESVPLDDVRAENEKLRMEVIYLSEQLATLKKINADRAELGEIREYCTPVQVIGDDASSSPGQSLNLNASSSDGLHAGQPVLCAAGIVGRVTSAGLAGAQVRLITDRDFRLTGFFARYEQSTAGGMKLLKIPTTPPVLKGMGQNRMVIENLDMKETTDAKLQVGDWVILDDPTNWPDQLRGYSVGKIASISPMRSHPLQAEIVVEPQVVLSRLQEVMVLTKSRDLRGRGN
jgi:cell shape-determining protein MreC